MNRLIKNITYVWLMMYFFAKPEMVKKLTLISPEKFIAEIMFDFGKTARNTIREVMEDIMVEEAKGNKLKERKNS